MQITITEEELRPCPRCGKSARISSCTAIAKDGRREMYNVFCDGNCHQPSLTKEEAIKAWNTRARDAEMQELPRFKREYRRLHALHKNLGSVNKQLKLAFDAISNRCIDEEIRHLINFIVYAVEIIEKEAKLEELIK